MSNPIRYSADDVDDMIRTTQRHRAKLIQAGHIDHFGREVHPQAPKAGDAKAAEPVTHDAYCVKCRQPRTVQTKKLHPAAKGRAARAEGDCPVCGTTTHAFKAEGDAKKLSDALQSTLAQTGE
jgi:hypothetical protein